MLKMKRKFTLGLTVFMSVSILCSNVVHASGVETISDEITENYIVESNISEEIDEEINEAINEESSVEDNEVFVEEDVIAEESDTSEELSESEPADNVEEQEILDESRESVSEEITEETEVIEAESSIENPYVWTSGDFQITHNIINDWGTGYQCEITITNTGEASIEDWKLVLETADTIDNIWNASIESAENGVYRIENLGWNANILSNGSVSFGYVASYEEELCVPTFYGVGGIEKELTDESYQVTYEVSNLWENGYVGNIVIHNLTDTDLRNWKITFDLSDTIVNLWNGNITGNENGQYTVQYASYNATIPAGGNVIIGFTAESDAPQVYPENYNVKVVVRNEMNTSSRDDVIGVAYFEPITEADIRIADDGIQYAVNQLNIVGNDGCTFEQIAVLGEEYGFEIVGYIEFTNDYQIKFINEKTYEELNKLCEEIKILEYIDTVYLNLINSVVDKQVEDVWYDEDEGVAYPATGEWALNWTGDIVKDSNWGMRAINAPEAWFYNNQMVPVKVGIMDSVFGPHYELEYEKIWNYENYGSDYSEWGQHGTIIAGIIASKWDNNRGIVGVSYNTDLYAYAYATGGSEEYYTTTIEIKYALALLIGNGVRVINSSTGIDPAVSYAATLGNTRAINNIKSFSVIVESFLVKLIERDYDFVIVQSAGNEKVSFFLEDDSDFGYRYLNSETYSNEPMNEAVMGTVNAKYGYCFSCMDSIKDRIIVVGAYGIDDENNIAMCDFSNTGEVVSVVAPGNNIYGTVPGDKYNDGKGKGTSFSAPYVAGIAALVYSVNPELSGTQVKGIIEDTATEILPGLGVHQEQLSGLGLTVPADEQEYKCVDAGAAVERALEESGNTPTLGENTGFIMGNVVYETGIGDTTKVAEGVEISAYRYSIYDGNVDTDYQYSTVSDTEGFFDLCVDPGMYQVTIYKEGYIPLIIERVQVLEGRVKYLDPILQIREFSFRQNYEITGRVVDALNASAIADANIVFREGWNKTEGETIDETAITDNNGMYTVTLKRGYYTAAISKDGYNTGYVNIVVYADMTIQEAVLSPYLQENEMRIVLTWGSSPSDLDSHMYITNGYTNYHVYYFNKKINIENSNVMCNLDHDDITAYGPETITLFLDDSTVNCKYSVYQYSSSGSLPLSGARVVVYYGSNEPVTFNVPVQGDGRTWDVFAVENGEIIPINTLY